jgi:hypothetical protein
LILSHCFLITASQPSFLLLTCFVACLVQFCWCEHCKARPSGTISLPEVGHHGMRTGT